MSDTQYITNIKLPQQQQALKIRDQQSVHQESIGKVSIKAKQASDSTESYNLILNPQDHEIKMTINNENSRADNQHGIGIKRYIAQDEYGKDYFRYKLDLKSIDGIDYSSYEVDANPVAINPEKICGNDKPIETDSAIATIPHYHELIVDGYIEPNSSASKTKILKLVQLKPDQAAIINVKIVFAQAVTNPIFSLQNYLGEDQFVRTQDFSDISSKDNKTFRLNAIRQNNNSDIMAIRLLIQSGSSNRIHYNVYKNSLLFTQSKRVLSL